MGHCEGPGQAQVSLTGRGWENKGAALLLPLLSDLLLGPPTGQIQPEGEGSPGAVDEVHAGQPPGAQRTGKMGGRQSWRTEDTVGTGVTAAAADPSRQGQE